jgi:hypothetical protein
MKPKQEEHLKGLVKKISEDFEEKYRRGAKEHGTILSEYKEETLIDEAINEALDLCAYLYTLKEKINERHCNRDSGCNSSKLE